MLAHGPVSGRRRRGGGAWRADRRRQPCPRLQTRAAVALPFDRPLPQVLAGFYSLERSGDLTFAWTSPQATVSLPGLDRQVPWRCTIRLRGGRAPDVTSPPSPIDIDGAPGARARPPISSKTSLSTCRRARDATASTLTIASVPTFVPGPATGASLASRWITWRARRPRRRAAAASSAGSRGDSPLRVSVSPLSRWAHRCGCRCWRPRPWPAPRRWRW